jgi:hypothetical protein
MKDRPNHAVTLIIYNSVKERLDEYIKYSETPLIQNSQSFSQLFSCSLQP